MRNKSPRDLKEKMVLWSPLLSFKLGCQGSSLGRTSTQGLNIIEEKGLPVQ